MKQSSGSIKGRLIAFLCCSILPLAGLGMGIFWLICHVRFTFWFSVTYIMIPGVAVWLFAWSMFSRRSAGMKVCLGILIAAVFVVVFGFLIFVSPYDQVVPYRGEKLQEQYITVKNDAPLMPELEEIGNPEKIELYESRHVMFIFMGVTDHLVCRYTPQEYAKQKELLETKYVLQTSEIYLRDEPYEYSAEVGDYTFRILSVEEYGDDDKFYYPKEFLLIGTSDKACEIVYMAYDDFELDYIPSLEEFIIDECCWKYIR